MSDKRGNTSDKTGGEKRRKQDNLSDLSISPFLRQVLNICTLQ